MEGFGIHTFRLVDADENQPLSNFMARDIGAASVMWDEAVKINGADPDFHRRDLFEAIAKGAFPEWEFGVQAFDETQADSFDFDVLDPTKIIPEEVIPIEMVGRMVLDRNPVNFFAETEQAAFHPGHLVPGIDFTNDPLLKGVCSLIPIRRSADLGARFSRAADKLPALSDAQSGAHGMCQMDVVPGRVSYEPNSLDPSGPREDPERGFRTFAPQEGAGETGQKLRVRPESFADHYSQARQFYRSMTPPEQRHIENAFAFELSKVEAPIIRGPDARPSCTGRGDFGARGRDRDRHGRGAGGDRAQRALVDLDPSPALSLIGKAKPTLKGQRSARLLRTAPTAIEWRLCAMR